MKAIILTGILLLALINTPAQLNTRTGDDIRITEPVNGDLYVAGKNVVIDAPVHGDVLAAGGTLIINDSITMDVIVAGGRVEINGYVGDDVRAAGGSIKVGDVIQGDVLVTGGEVIIEKNSVLHGNLYTTGGMVTIDGAIDGAVEAKGRDLKIGGMIKGPASIAANVINVKSSALFGSDIRFWNDEGSLNIASHSHHGTVTLDPELEIRGPQWQYLGFASALIMLWYLGTALLMIWLIEFLFPKSFSDAAGIVLNHTMKSLGYGLLYFAGVPFLCVLLAITIIALPIGIIAMIAYGVLLVLATIITAIVISNWLNRVYFKSSWSLSKLVFVAFGIFVFLKIVTLTPVFGPLLIGIAASMAFGGIVLSTFKVKSNV